MSRLYWHTQHDGTAEVLGAEYMHCRLVTLKLAKAMLPSVDIACHRMTHSARGRIFKSDWPNFERDMHLWIDAEDEATDPMFRNEFGIGLKNRYLILNTALVLGNDVVALFTRITGQASLHAYVEGEHREWLAGIIKQGLDSGICRTSIYSHDSDGRRFNPTPSGWEAVIRLLLKRDDEPVVMSYSVDEPFPDAALCEVDFDSEDSEKAWKLLGYDGQWEASLARLRQRNLEWRLEISPATLRLPFGHCVNIFQLFNE